MNPIHKSTKFKEQIKRELGFLMTEQKVGKKEYQYVINTKAEDPLTRQL